MENVKRPRLQDLHRIMDDSFVVRHIAVPLESCNVSDDAHEVKGRMESMHFDLMGLRENGVISGYVRREELNKGPCRNYRKPILPNDIVSSNTPLGRLLPILAARPHLFVLEHTKIDGVVTRADLQKDPVRMVLFGLLSLMEMYLLSMIRLCYTSKALERMPSLEDAKMLLGDRLRRNEDIDLADCLYLSDKTTLLLKVPGFADFFGLGLPRDAQQYFKNIESMRNKLAHGHDLVKGSGWDRVAQTIFNLESFLSDCDKKYDEFQSKFAKQ